MTRPSRSLVNSVFPVPPEDEWVTSPRHRLFRVAGLAWPVAAGRTEMPVRQVMIEAYLAGTCRPLRDRRGGEEAGNDGTVEEPSQTRSPSQERRISTPRSPMPAIRALDTLWGYYFATGSHRRSCHLQILPWVEERDPRQADVPSASRYTRQLTRCAIAKLPGFFSVRELPGRRRL